MTPNQRALLCFCSISFSSRRLVRHRSRAPRPSRARLLLCPISCSSSPSREPPKSPAKQPYSHIPVGLGGREAENRSQRHQSGAALVHPSQSLPESGIRPLGSQFRRLEERPAAKRDGGRRRRRRRRGRGLRAGAVDGQRQGDSPGAALQRLHRRQLHHQEEGPPPGRRRLRCPRRSPPSRPLALS